MDTALLSNGPVVAQQGLNFGNRLFALEQHIKDANPKERLAVRQKRSLLPVVEVFREWLEQMNSDAMKKMVFGQAITCCLKQWEKADDIPTRRYGGAGQQPRRAHIKPFMIGQKNWLFANTPQGTRSSAIIYSIVETAKEKGLNPLAYLTYTFEQPPNVDVVNLANPERYLPWSKALPSNCYSSTKNRTR